MATEVAEKQDGKHSLIAADKAYVAGRYEEAADLYAAASEAAAAENGDDAPGNADVLFLYGRALFKIAMQRTDVLGGGAAPQGVDVAATLAAALPTAPVTSAAGSASNGAASATNASAKTSAGAAPADPRFSFTGDGADDDAEEGDWEDDDGAQAAEEPEDAFEAAWEVLDLARVGYEAQLADESNAAWQDKVAIRRRIAETYDLLGEVSLENESFDQAVSDLRKALALKKELYPADHSEVSGAYYMAALALEYSTAPGAREEAAECVAAAVQSFEQRLQSKQGDITERQRREQGEMLAELRSKLAELRQPAAVVDKEQVAEMFGLGPVTGLGASTGAGVGSSAATKDALKEQVAKAMANSNDLSSLVRKKEKKRPAPATDPAATAEPAAEGATKKAKVEDAPDAGN